MKKTTLFAVNLQQGFLLMDGHIIAAYDHWNKAIIFQPVISVQDKIELPTEIATYDQYHHYTDSFSIQCYTKYGYKTPYQVTQLADNRETANGRG